MDGSEHSKLLITMFPSLFTKFEKQSSTVLAWVQLSTEDEIMNWINILWGYEKRTNEQTMSNPAIEFIHSDDRRQAT